MGPDHTMSKAEAEAARPSSPASAPTANRPDVPSSRVGRAWTTLLPAAVVVIVMLIFVLQNLRRSDVSFLIWSGGFPVGVALLASAALGGLAVFLLGSVRIIQLRRMVRRDARDQRSLRQQ